MPFLRGGAAPGDDDSSEGLLTRGIAVAHLKVSTRFMQTNADMKRLRVHVDSGESVQHPRLYAVGQLCGDSFVRHMCGGVLKVAKSMVKEAHRSVCCVLAV